MQSTIETPFPRLGEALRALITATGFRPFIEEKGLDKNLDDLFREPANRQGTLYELLEEIQGKFFGEVVRECGEGWNFIIPEWENFCHIIQHVVQTVDVSCSQSEKVRSLFEEYFIIPFLAEFMLHAVKTQNGGDAREWAARPFQAWLELASSLPGQKRAPKDIERAIEKNPRSIERWKQCHPMESMSYPLRKKVGDILGESARMPDVARLAGWLYMARALQSLSPQIRASIGDYLERRTSPWDPEEARIKLLKALDGMENPAFIQKMNDLRNEDPARKRAEIMRELMKLNPIWTQCEENIEAALQADQKDNVKEVMNFLGRAVDVAWWRTGPVQSELLDKALKYAVGTGDKVAARAYWDRSFMLGLNRGPKRELDEQQMRSLSLAFEHDFPHRKAKLRVPPAFECMTFDEIEDMKNKSMKAPARKTAHAQGRTRRTALMNAILCSSLADVKKLIENGANPDEFIPESGENPLIYAMRHAEQTRDTSIMDYFLSLPLKPETVKRIASTEKDCPLMLAIDMGHAKAVERLIELGADIRLPIYQSASALLYAMHKFNEARQGGITPEIQAQYLAGYGPVGSHEAKQGVVFDCQKADFRAMQMIRRMESFGAGRYTEIWKAVCAHYLPSPDDCRAVIHVLLEAGADVNLRYHVPDNSFEWSPTLLAAEIGDLALFREILAYGGNPDQTLLVPGPFEKRDALWIAIDHGNDAIVSFMQNRRQKDGK